MTETHEHKSKYYYIEQIKTGWLVTCPVIGFSQVEQTETAAHEAAKAAIDFIGG